MIIMNILHTFSKDYLDDILVRLAHHSAGIEGNTISLPATVSIIVNGTLPMSGKATVREFYEIENHKHAFDNILTHLINEETLTIDIIKEIHADLTDRLQYNRGQFKKNENMILGAEFQTASPSETPYLMTQLIDNLTYRLEVAESDDDKLLAILDTHIQFERIHPFSDGNGRTGRMVLNYSLLQQGFPPLIIEKEQKRMQRFQNMEQEKIRFPKS